MEACEELTALDTWTLVAKTLEAKTAKYAV